MPGRNPSEQAAGILRNGWPIWLRIGGRNQRNTHERGATIITSNRVYKKWPEIFNNDSTLTSALLDRLLHHTETVVIEGKSYRMKDQIES